MRIIQNIFAVLLFIIGHKALAQHQVCYTPLKERGVCISLKYCPDVVNLFTQISQESAAQYSMALRNICGRTKTLDNYPIVCCSRVVMNEVVEDKVPDEDLENIFTQLPPTNRTEKTSENEDRSKDDSKSTSSTEIEKTCIGVNHEAGLCKPLRNCTQLYSRLKDDPTSETLKTYLRSSHAICGAVETTICCPSGDPVVPKSRSEVSNENIPRRLPNEDDGCGLVTLPSPKVVGGVDSRIGEWPWVALVGYNAYSLKPFKCGGTLVTARHVITAAHCLRSDLSFVRLGEFDLSITNDTNHVDVNVIKMVGHPNFGRDGRNDVAVLFLERNVEFSDIICPICMPSSNYLRGKSYVNSNPFVAGWGNTMENGSGSLVLQQLQIPVLENAVCRKVYKSRGRLITEDQFDDSVICAGILAGGADTCQGDSGGPLMIPEPYKGVTRYYLLGVVSYGIGCAQVGVPGVYTNVRHYMDWINEKISDT